MIANGLEDEEYFPCWMVEIDASDDKYIKELVQYAKKHEDTVSLVPHGIVRCFLKEEKLAKEYAKSWRAKARPFGQTRENFHVRVWDMCQPDLGSRAQNNRIDSYL